MTTETFTQELIRKISACRRVTDEAPTMTCDDIELAALVLDNNYRIAGLPHEANGNCALRRIWGLAIDALNARGRVLGS